MHKITLHFYCKVSDRSTTVEGTRALNEQPTYNPLLRFTRFDAGLFDMLFLELFFSFYTKHNLFLLSKTNILGIHDIVLTRILSDNDEKTAGIKTGAQS